MRCFVAINDFFVFFVVRQSRPFHLHIGNWRVFCFFDVIKIQCDVKNHFFLSYFDPCVCERATVLDRVPINQKNRKRQNRNNCLSDLLLESWCLLDSVVIIALIFLVQLSHELVKINCEWPAINTPVLPPENKRIYDDDHETSENSCTSNESTRRQRKRMNEREQCRTSNELIKLEFSLA